MIRDRTAPVAQVTASRISPRTREWTLPHDGGAGDLVDPSALPGSLGAYGSAVGSSGPGRASGSGRLCKSV